MQAFCDLQGLLRDSDLERRKFATDALKNLRFMFKDSRHEDKEVRKPGCYPISYASNMRAI
jgi:hypothetical protein